MAFTSKYVSVTTSATALNTAGSGADPYDSSTNVLVKNPSSTVTVYLGGAGVTADTTAGTGGWPLAPGEDRWVPCDPGETLYGIVAASTQSVNVLAQGT